MMKNVQPIKDRQCHLMRIIRKIFLESHDVLICKMRNHDKYTGGTTTVMIQTRYFNEHSDGSSVIIDPGSSETYKRLTDEGYKPELNYRIVDSEMLRSEQLLLKITEKGIK